MSPTPALTISNTLVLIALIVPGITHGADTGEAMTDCTVAIYNVSVVPMDAERVLSDRTVRLDRDRITAIVKSNNDSGPECRQVVDGSGMFLLPGLNDMHVHLPTKSFAQALGQPADLVDFEAAMAPYLVHGVTGIRVLSGAPDILAFRDGEPATPRPRLSIASPMLSGEPPVLPEPLTRVVSTPELGREVVRGYAADGYDFIKIRDNLAPDVFRAVVEQAIREGLYVEGHLLKTLGIDEVLSSGQRGFSHVDNFVLAAMGDPSIDSRGFADALIQCDCFVTTALIIDKSAMQQIDEYERAFERSETSHVPPLIREAFWKKPNNPYLNATVPDGFFEQLLHGGMELVKTFSDSGIRVLAGSDALNPMVAPGVGLHDELDILVDAGLSNFDVLRTATVNAAAVPGFEQTGVLAAGRVANALLVSGNPLEDVSVLRRPVAVIVGGRWLSRKDLDRMLEEMTTHYAHDDLARSM